MALVFVGGAESASAATLKANYQLQGNRLSAVAGAPELANLGQGNRFEFESIGGADRQVLAFPKGNGLSLATTGLVDPNDHSVVMVFRLDETNGYRRILDFSKGTSDNGLYNLSGQVVLYGTEARSKGIVLDQSYAQVVFTSATAPGGSRRAVVYVDGEEVAAAKTTEGYGLDPGELRFFKDNTSGPAPGEESAGAVSCILVYDGALTPGEVGQLAGDPSLCPVPPSTPGRPQATRAGRPRAIELGKQGIIVNTGLRVSCPIGAAPCRASARVDVASGPPKATATRVKRLGAVKFTVRPGASTGVLMRLSRRGAKALREAGRLRVRAAVEITSPGGRRAIARQTGAIGVSPPPPYRLGSYTGTTSQGLPIVIAVSRRGIQSVFFRWRVRCADGEAHTNAVFIRGKKIRRGHFSFGQDLNTGGSVRISGRIRGVHASGTLSRKGPSPFGAKCALRGVTWHARAAGVEIGL